MSDLIHFTNSFPEDKEWTAHIGLLNKWTKPDRYLRQIVQYARSGEFYPADMHVDLIRQVIAQALEQFILDNSTPTEFEIDGEPVSMIRFTQSDLDELAKTLKGVE